MELTDYVERQVNPQLAAIEGVQRVELSGGRSPAMRVWIDPARSRRSTSAPTR